MSSDFRIKQAFLHGLMTMGDGVDSGVAQDIGYATGPKEAAVETIAALRVAELMCDLGRVVCGDCAKVVPCDIHTREVSGRITTV